MHGVGADVCKYNQCCAIMHYYNKCPYPRKVGGTKHRASPSLQKVGEMFLCPPTDLRQCTCISKTKFLGQGFLKYTTECITTLDSQVALIHDFTSHD